MTVELKEFVAKTLQDVLEGVMVAQDNQNPLVGKNVAPWGIGGTRFPAESGAVVAHSGSMTFVKFDVAVTAESEDATKGGGSLKVAVVSMGMEKGTAERSTSATRIQFTVPVLLPAGDRNRGQ